jgi:serine phosphatase RsbU (regulator of sigma subunit)/Tfp pilus assembly protein PilF
MRFILRYSYTILLILILCLNGFGQKSDSLWAIWSDSSVESVDRNEAIDQLAWSFMGSDLDSAYLLGETLFDSARSVDDKRWMSKALNIKGASKYFKANYSSALQSFQQSLKLQLELDNKTGIANAHNLIGVIRKEQEDYDDALKHYNESLSIYEALSDSPGVAKLFNNIGEVYFRLGQYDKALDYHQKCLNYNDSLNNTAAFKSIALSNIGRDFLKLKDYKKALDALNQSLEIRISIGDEYPISNSLIRIADTYFEMKDYAKAEEHAVKSLDYAKQAGVVVESMHATRLLSDIYEINKSPSKSLIYYKQYIKLRDSVNDVKQRELNFDLQNKLAYDLQAKTDSIKYDEEIRLTQSNLKYEKNLRWILSIGILLVVALFLFLLDRSIKTKKQKVIIEDQHLKLNKTYKEVKDSIDYAKKIQDALMISEESRLEIFPESFVFYSPKDVVSGDFYWLYSKLKTNEVYFSVADCTGHGVPGAFMSMIGNSVLNEVVVEEGVTQTDEILNHTRDLIKKAFNDNETTKDGMDIAFCKYNIISKIIQFSGAFNPLYVVSKGELIEFKANPQPVGYNVPNESPFTKTDFKVKKDDMVYVFSDGFKDQFGGPKEKKFMTSRFKKLLITASELNCNDQKNYIAKEFNNWKGEIEQIDDVCVMGVRIT